MSLQLAAQHLSSQGRGSDDTLVHMSRDEVKSLNDLAMAHGGQLTINPQTGLPEAGFLSMILPMVAGAALGPAGMGLTAMQAGLAVGAGSYLLNPKGGLLGALSSGLGGYGGAGLGQGLASLGATSEAGLTSTGASMDYAAQNAEAIKNAQAFEQAKLAQAAQTNAQALENAKYFTDYGAPVNEFAQVSSGLPTSPGGMEVAASTPARPPIGADYENVLPRGNLLETPLTGNQLGPSATGFDAMSRGAQSLLTDPTADKFKALGGGSWTGLAQTGLAAAAPAISQRSKFTPPPLTQQKQQVVPHYRFNPGMVTPTPVAGATGAENIYFKPSYTALTNEEAANLYPGYPAAAADGGLMGYAGGGPVEQMSTNATLGANTMYPMANMRTSSFATPYQAPQSINMLAPSGGGTVDQMSGEPNMQGTRLAEGGVAKYGFGGFLGDAVSNIGSSLGHMFKGGDSSGWAQLEAAMGGKPKQNSGQTTASDVMYDPQTQQYQQMSAGGISDARYNLGGYSDGGRLLRGPGDGVSDSIPAVIGKKQPARLADGEFVVPARIVSELGNGSTEAGARKLYAMMDRVQAARRNTIGKGKVAKNNRADRYLPA